MLLSSEYFHTVVVLFSQIKLLQHIIVTKSLKWLYNPLIFGQLGHLELPVTGHSLKVYIDTTSSERSYIFACMI